MSDAMPPHSPGEVWSVLGVEGGVMVLLAGPFDAAHGQREYLAAPLYTGKEEGFVWTDQDVRLAADESPSDNELFVGVWNARPVLEDDLFVLLGQLADEALTVARDVYWAALNEETVEAEERLGRSIRSADDPAARFQVAEMDRWSAVSDRVHQEGVPKPEPQSDPFCESPEFFGSFQFHWEGSPKLHLFGPQTSWLLYAEADPAHERMLPTPTIIAAEPSSVRTAITASTEAKNPMRALASWSSWFRGGYETVLEGSVSLELNSDWPRSTGKASAA